MLFALCLAPLVGAEPAQPNLLIIVADDLGFADVGFNSGKVSATPNLDRLAATGVNLTDFRSCPMCSPTRAGLMTGRWPARFGLMRAVMPPWSRYGLPSEENTRPALLGAIGYGERALMGKWHLGHAQREFGTWQNRGVAPCNEGRAGFVPPKDWIVGGPLATPREATAPKAGKNEKIRIS